MLDQGITKLKGSYVDPFCPYLQYHWHCEPPRDYERLMQSRPKLAVKASQLCIYSLLVLDYHPASTYYPAPAIQDDPAPALQLPPVMEMDGMWIDPHPHPPKSTKPKWMWMDVDGSEWISIFIHLPKCAWFPRWFRKHV